MGMKYKLTIVFETTKPVKKHHSSLVQFENALSYFVSEHIDDTFIYGSGKTVLTKVIKKKK